MTCVVRGMELQEKHKEPFMWLTNTNRGDLVFIDMFSVVSLFQYCV